MRANCVRPLWFINDFICQPMIFHIENTYQNYGLTIIQAGDQWSPLQNKGKIHCFYPNSVLYCSSKMKIKIPQYIHIFLGQYISTIRKRIGTCFNHKILLSNWHGLTIIRRATNGHPYRINEIKERSLTPWLRVFRLLLRLPKSLLLFYIR